MSVQETIRRVAAGFREARRVSAIQRAREKVEGERVQAEIELILDDVAAEGFDPRGPVGLATVLEEGKRRARLIAAQSEERDPFDPVDDFTRGKF